MLAPQLLRLERVETAIIDRLQLELPSYEVGLDKVSFHWRPVPFVTLRDVQLHHENWRLKAPEAEFHPAWRTIFGKQGSAGRIVLRQPSLIIKNQQRPGGEGKSAAEPGHRLPQLAITIKDGTLSTAAGLLSSPFQGEEMRISGIQGKLDFAGGKIAIRANGTAPFSKGISVRGNWNLPDNAYLLTVEAEGFELHRAISSITGIPVIPGKSVVDFTGEIQGHGLAEFRADIKGRLPCLLLRPEDRQLLITCGYADLSLRKSGSDMELQIHDLEVREPQLNLQGRISRSQPVTGAEPDWLIDLTATDLDVARVREKVLAFLDPHPILSQVTDLLRAGSAPAVNFQFTGPAADLRRFERLSITGTLNGTELMVPTVNLHLLEVGGEFAIKEGRLHGSDLQAKLGASTGRNGSLLLDIIGGFAIELALDLEAELAELSEALHKTVRHEKFLREVDKFSEIDGWASGHLRVDHAPGDTQVRVKVRDFEVSGRYERLEWPFAARGGRLDILSSQQVTWEAVRGEIGPHLVKEATGSVSWRDVIHLDARSLEAKLAAGPLVRELNSHPFVRQKILQAINKIDGSLEVTGGSLRGPWHQPEQWQYRLEGVAHDLSWRSPLLSQPVSTRQASFVMDEKEIQVIASDNVILDRPLLLQGKFSHRLLGQWHGWVELNGTVDARLSRWVREQGWIPEKFYPRVPFTMDDLRIDWTAQSFGLSGGIAGGNRKSSLPRADLQLSSTKKDLVLRRLDITSADEHALFALHLPRNSQEGFMLDWRGALEGRTLDGLLEKNHFLSGRLAGIWSFHYAPREPLQTRMVGVLQVEDFKLPFPAQEPLTVIRLRATGNGNSLNIPLLQVAIGDEEISGRGRITSISEGLDLDLALNSSLLSWPTVSSLQSALRPAPEMASPKESEEESKNRQSPLSFWDLQGRIAFELEEFVYPGLPASSHGTAEENSDSYRWQPLQGSLHLHLEESWRVEIAHADLCGLIISGTWSSGAAELSRFQLRSAPSGVTAFEQVMPCLGMKQDLVIGNFNLEASLSGKPGEWIDGAASLQSEQGNIRRLTFLSRVFKVVNLTDLFKNSSGFDTVEGGLPYTTMELKAEVVDNQLVFEKAMVHGEGLNLFGRGRFELDTYRADLTILIAPFKTLDLIISKVPLIGRVVGGKNATLLTFPVAVKGPISDPSVVVMDPEAVGEGFLLLAKEILRLPITILRPIFSGEYSERAEYAPDGRPGGEDRKEFSGTSEDEDGNSKGRREFRYDPVEGSQPELERAEEEGNQERQAEFFTSAQGTAKFTPVDNRPAGNSAVPGGFAPLRQGS